MMQTQDVINVKNLRKYYDSVKAVDGISFTMKTGEIFGMVGPNGFGPTTQGGLGPPFASGIPSPRFAGLRQNFGLRPLGIS